MDFIYNRFEKNVFSLTSLDIHRNDKSCNIGSLLNNSARTLPARTTG